MNFVSTSITIAIPMIAIIRQIGNEVTGAVTICCNGILIDPSIIPISVATVSCLWFSSMYFIILLIANLSDNSNHRNGNSNAGGNKIQL